MHTGVHALLLAAVTALPFTPPAGWVQLPSSVAGADVNNLWKGPKPAHGAAETFSAMAFPFPGTVDMLAASGTKAAGKTKIVKTLSDQTIALCGIPARLVTLRVQSDSGVSLLQHEIAVRGGYAYMLMYTREAATPANPAVGAVMRNFCPSGTPVIGDLKMPAGWTKSLPEMQIAGTWLGTQPGQLMSLMRATQMNTLDDVLASTQKQSPATKSGKGLMKITMEKSVTMCGHPGKLADMQVTGELPVTMHMALTQGDGTAYVLTYLQMGTAPADPAALASLQTLCATSASPAPSAPMPSISPSAAPSAAATSRPIRP